MGINYLIDFKSKAAFHSNGSSSAFSIKTIVNIKDKMKDETRNLANSFPLLTSKQRFIHEKAIS